MGDSHSSSDDGSDGSGTQPMDTLIEVCSDKESSQSGKIWGWLHPAQDSKMKSLALTKEISVVGRQKDSDYVFTKEEFEDESQYTTTSNRQFQIKKDGLSTFLYDLSMNGTFVNKHKVGKGSKVPLCHSDTISILFPQNKIFIFMQMETSSSFLTDELKEKYTLKILLGKGGFGEVRLALDKRSLKDVALKKIARRTDESHNREITILQQLNHQNIVSMKKVYHSEAYTWIVMEYVPGGTLHNKIIESGKLTEMDSKSIFYQLANALMYLHGKGVAHRDLKPNNILLSGHPEGDLVKVADFGMSKLCSADNELRTFCGTPVYTAPEVYLTVTRGVGVYSVDVDIWSLGVCLYQCLSGQLPFDPKRVDMPLNEQIARGSYSCRGPNWKRVSSQAISLISRMIVAPELRITIQNIFRHAWLQDQLMEERVCRIIQRHNDF